MSLRRGFITSMCLLLVFAGGVQAEGLTVGKDASVATVLASQKGKRVTVKLRNGEELTGTVVETGKEVVHLGALSTKEFFDAVVPMDKIDAVIIRTKDQ